MEFVAKVIQFGRVTIPSEIRQWMGIEEGDIVELSVRKVHKRNGAEVMTAAELMREHDEGD